MLKNALFFWKKLKNRRSVGGSDPKPPLASGGCELLFSLRLRAIFSTAQRFSAPLKLRPIISYLSDG